jgi:hypothetical protein
MLVCRSRVQPILARCFMKQHNLVHVRYFLACKELIVYRSFEFTLILDHKAHSAWKSPFWLLSYSFTCSKNEKPIMH